MALTELEKLLLAKLGNGTDDDGDDGDDDSDEDRDICDGCSEYEDECTCGGDEKLEEQRERDAVLATLNIRAGQLLEALQMRTNSVDQKIQKIASVLSGSTLDKNLDRIERAIKRLSELDHDAEVANIRIKTLTESNHSFSNEAARLRKENDQIAEREKQLMERWRSQVETLNARIRNLENQAANEIIKNRIMQPSDA